MNSRKLDPVGPTDDKNDALDCRSVVARLLGRLLAREWLGRKHAATTGRVAPQIDQDSDELKDSDSKMII